MTTLIRMLLTTILLYFVWVNSHWSVATCLALLAIQLEADAILSHRKFKVVKNLLISLDERH